MKRFLIFKYPEYEAHGGLYDLCKLCDTYEESNEYVLTQTERRVFCIFQVLDITTGEIIIYDPNELKSENIEIEKIVRDY